MLGGTYPSNDRVVWGLLEGRCGGGGGRWELGNVDFEGFGLIRMHRWELKIAWNYSTFRFRWGLGSELVGVTLVFVETSEKVEERGGHALW